MRRRGSGCVPFRAENSTAAKQTEHSRKHSEVFQKFDIWAIYIFTVLTGADRRSLAAGLRQLQNPIYRSFADAKLQANSGTN